jgi:hypothetical protein
MLRKVALLAAALAIVVPAVANTIPPAGPGKATIVGPAGLPKKVVVKKPVPCNPKPGQACRR